jgi:hypothetical protein
MNSDRLAKALRSSLKLFSPINFSKLIRMEKFDLRLPLGKIWIMKRSIINNISV